MASASYALSSDGGTSYLAVDTPMADANALAYDAASSYSIKALIDSTAGCDSIAWSITTADDAHVASLPAITTDGTTKSAYCTFSVPKQGGAWILRCFVNNGIGPAGASAALDKSMSVKVLFANGNQVIAVGETMESSTVHGWLKALNDFLRA